jgi:hypothetical protein
VSAYDEVFLTLLEFKTGKFKFFNSLTQLKTPTANSLHVGAFFYDKWLHFINRDSVGVGMFVGYLVSLGCLDC